LPDPPQNFIDSTMISAMLYHIFHRWYLASFYTSNRFSLPRRSFTYVPTVY
jgi:hypothetical protein